ncbi:CBS domain-containing protein [Terrimicrobium sacchariphilum]|uniref:CBS domain-containing protein n=1 Tax=Terrimicrobium sacchariphilum TaxID=690879 RepID=A0A146GBJ6_TERSA|nr:CBS domain-containing protein [Terrimicrobium sacchariphilum]GAT34741.1 CBS domain-containing protein [Terrimicrobium sacchariphilum]
MCQIEEKLKDISDSLKKGTAPQKETVRTFLSWFGSERRGWRTVTWIRETLKKYDLITYPDFESTYIDEYISFFISKGDESTYTTPTLSDPTYRVGRLPAANNRPSSVKPDSTLQQIITIMLTSDYSQVPVMTSSRDVKGIVSWKTIGSRLALKKTCAFARDCMEPAQTISSEASLFSAISIITTSDYVLVRSSDHQISGIITASDFNEQFQILAEPFILIGEIENGIRRMLYGKFTLPELKIAKSPSDEQREINGISDLTFGEYIHLLEQEKYWKKLNLEIDRSEFVKQLDKIRLIRNDVMHFDPDGLDQTDLCSLREFAQFLRRLRDVGAM